MGACEQCINNNCYSSGCNSNCKQTGDICYTEWLGGADNPLPEGIGQEQLDKLDHAVFTRMFLVMKPTLRMSKAGIYVGDFITHINNSYPKDSADFGEMIKTLPKGTVLRVFRRTTMAYEDVVL